MKYHIIFDLDGTLIDSAEGIYYAFQKACDEINKRTPEYALFKTHIGPPIRVIAKNIFNELNETEIDEIEAAFRKHYDIEGVSFYKVYDGIDNAIKTLSEYKNLVVSIVTNKPTLLASRIVNEQAWEDYFEYVIGIDFPQLRYSKRAFNNKAESLMYTIKLSGIKQCNTYYFGEDL